MHQYSPAVCNGFVMFFRLEMIGSCFVFLVCVCTSSLDLTCYALIFGFFSTSYILLLCFFHVEMRKNRFDNYLKKTIVY